MEKSARAMGGVFTIVAYGEEPSLSEGIEKAFGEAQRLDHLLSNYRPESEWSVVNRRAAGEPVAISQESIALLQACIEYSKQSEGTFDITVGPLMNVWGFFQGSGSVPDPLALRDAKRLTGWRNLLLDPDARTVRFAKSGVQIDPGGIGKGYAVDRMEEILRRNGIRSALISAASSSIYAIGAPPGEDGWSVAIQNQQVCLRDESVSTSGAEGKFFVSGGRLYGHIMDPRTGNPADGAFSVSVISPRTIDSEAWGKPFLILGRDWTKRHKKPEFQVFMCEQKGHCSWV